MEHKSEGYCRFCLKIFSSAGMGRHLAACKMRKEKNGLELKEGRKKYKIYHLKISGGKNSFTRHFYLTGFIKILSIAFSNALLNSSLRSIIRK